MAEKISLDAVFISDRLKKPFLDYLEKYAIRKNSGQRFISYDDMLIYIQQKLSAQSIKMILRDKKKWNI